MRDTAAQQSRIQQHRNWSCPSTALHKLVYLHRIIINESRYILNTLCYKQVTMDFYGGGGITLLQVSDMTESRQGRAGQEKGRPRLRTRSGRMEV